ncbi:flavin-containing monooxygenase [Aquibaculum sediminis]|uniref:flavin-containing monooxygenase n=1 Tax=Aquibaculum sediminis TaxID=3231907 RepID=UPI0034565EE3
MSAVKARPAVEATTPTVNFGRAEEIVAVGAAVATLRRDEALARRLAEEVAERGRGRISDELIETIRLAAAEEAEAGRITPRLEGDSRLATLLVTACLGTEVEAQERLMLLDQSDLLADEPQPRPLGSHPQAVEQKRVAVIGAGASGIAMGRELLEAGYAVTLFERDHHCAGTWAQNLYPGCGVDSPSYVYSYSYAQKPDWSRYFVRRAEIADYLEDCATRFGLRAHIRFATEVLACDYDAQRCRWDVTSQAGRAAPRTESYDAVVSAVGQLNSPAWPSIPGLERFSGPLVHTACWDPALDLKGKRVAVVGVGASAMQVVPTIAPEVAQLTVFQRQPHWVMPNRHYLAEVPAAEIARQKALPAYLAWKRLVFNWNYGDYAFPALLQDPEWPQDVPDALNARSARLRDMMLRHIRRQLAGRPDLIAKMTPGYPPYSKRLLLDNNWYKTFLRDNVRLVTEGIAQLLPEGIETQDGERHDFDVIIFATGFAASRMLSSFEVMNGQGQSLRGLWGDDNPRAHLGVTVPGFPNFFMLYGPNTNLAFGGSAIIHSEIQSRYIVQCLDMATEAGAEALECRAEAFEAYNHEADARLSRMVWSLGGSTSWFKNTSGRVTTNSPWSMGEYWARLRQPDPNDFHFVRAEEDQR